MSYDKRHGGAYDRGSADSHYGRVPRPHYFIGDTYSSDEVICTEGSEAYKAYMAGYEDNERFGSKKDYA